MVNTIFEYFKYYLGIFRTGFHAWFMEIELIGLIDIIIMTFLIYTILVWFKRTRAAFILKGIFIVGFVYLLIRQFNLIMATEVFEQFFAIILIALVVIFQEELRHFFEQVALFSLNQRSPSKKAFISREEVEILVRTVMDLAKEKIGALIVIRGRDILARHLQGGVILNGQLSGPLLKSLFDPHSAGHDGAVIIEGNHVTQFSTMLPLSKNVRKIQDRGTRHAAALGLSELTDALCIVFSEEKGAVSIARHSEIEQVPDAEKVTLVLERFYKEVYPRRRDAPLLEFLARNSLEKVYAVLLALTLWFVLVHGAKVTSKTYTLPINLGEIPATFKVMDISPKDVDVTFHAPRSAFYLLKDEQLKLFLQPKLKRGVQRVKMHSDNLTYPKDLVIEYFSPDEIKVRLEEVQDNNIKAAEAPPPIQE